MKRTKKSEPSLAKQMHKRQGAPVKKKKLDGNTETMISTGSTLLDLAICGKRKRGGGIPGGILLEAFGPESSGKTVLLCEIGGSIQRKGGDILFNDPEARLNTQFANIFDLDTDELTIENPDTVTEIFSTLREWEPKTKSKIHGIMTDSLAALSTNLEMGDDAGDKMGMRRAKEFSEGFRKTCRMLKKENYIMACSNQIRDKASIGPGEKFTVPGGKAIAFYSSLRLRFYKPEKITEIKKVHGKEIKKVIGTKVKVEVYKSSIDSPYRTADLYIQFNYGIDDIRANIQYLKDYTSAKAYELHGVGLGKSMNEATAFIEDEGLEKELKEAVIDLWEILDEKFNTNRKRKER